MSKSAALKLLLASVFVGSCSACASPIGAWLQTVGFDTNNASLLSGGVAVVAALTGVAGLVVGGTLLVRAAWREEEWVPIREALAPIAAEHGQGVWQDLERGIGFSALRDGQQIEVSVSPSERTLAMRSRVPARQPLAWVGRDVPEESPWSAWREAGEGYRWLLRAELTSIARALQADASLTTELDRFFESAPDARVVHDRGGIGVRCAFSAPELLERQVRRGIELCFRIRRVNG